MFEVYIARYEGVVYYVGEGKKGRHLHVNSGISNCYLLNSMHHKQGIVFDVEVIPLPDKESSQEMEKKLILELHPIGNKSSNRQRSKFKSNIDHLRLQHFKFKDYLNFLLDRSNVFGEAYYKEVDLDNVDCGKKRLTSCLLNNQKGSHNILLDLLQIEKMKSLEYKVTFKRDFWEIIL